MADPDITVALLNVVPQLWRHALRLSRDSDDAEYLVHGACVRALEGTHQRQADSGFRSWIFSIVHRVWDDELNAGRARARVRTRSTVERDEALSTSIEDSSSGSSGDTIRFEQIVDRVERLPESQRSIIILVAVEGFSYTETAEILGMPLETVMRKYSHAQKTVEGELSYVAAR